MAYNQVNLQNSQNLQLPISQMIQCRRSRGVATDNDFYCGNFYPSHEMTKARTQCIYCTRKRVNHDRQKKEAIVNEDSLKLQDEYIKMKQTVQMMIEEKEKIRGEVREQVRQEIYQEIRGEVYQEKEKNRQEKEKIQREIKSLNEEILNLNDQNLDLKTLIENKDKLIENLKREIEDRDNEIKNKNRELKFLKRNLNEN